MNGSRLKIRQKFDDPAALALNPLPLGFLASFLGSRPEVPPEQFRAAPVALVHPAVDRWTPPAMSLAFFQRIAAPKRYVALTNCGHFPVEEPEIGELAGVLEDVYAGRLDSDLFRTFHRRPRTPESLWS